MLRAMLQFLKSIIKGILDLKEETQQLTGNYTVSSEMEQKLKKFEGYSEKAYQDTVGVWTIGYGNTYYADHSPVKEGDTITRSEAEKLFRDVLDEFSQEVGDLIRSNINNCQFDALVCLTYNIGIDRFKTSTLLKKVNLNPLNNVKSNVTIFKKYHKRYS